MHRAALIAAGLCGLVSGCAFPLVPETAETALENQSLGALVETCTEFNQVSSQLGDRLEALPVGELTVDQADRYDDAVTAAAWRCKDDERAGQHISVVRELTEDLRQMLPETGGLY